jgi:hypothetical protein
VTSDDVLNAMISDERLNSSAPGRLQGIRCAGLLSDIVNEIGKNDRFAPFSAAEVAKLRASIDERVSDLLVLLAAVSAAKAQRPAPLSIAKGSKERPS